jgi:hypothetical protein
MSFDDELFQPFVRDRQDYKQKIVRSNEDGYTVVSPVYSPWNSKEADAFINQADALDIDFRFVVLNEFYDMQFLFATEKDYSFFLLTFNDVLNSKENLGYVR